MRAKLLLVAASCLISTARRRGHRPTLWIESGLRGDPAYSELQRRVGIDVWENPLLFRDTAYQLSERDGHWAPCAHRSIADEILRRLAQRSSP